jgi:acetyl coenzyme A synthetase (ADP forming)-like protein
LTLLKYFFRPESVAVVGASTSPGKVGYDILHNLLKFGYKGRVYPVNPNAKTILDTPVIPSIADLPEVVDLAVIAVPASITPSSLRELGERGVKACVVVSSGFKEVGGEGVQLEAELAKVVKETGIRVIGPNCVGIMDTAVGLNASFAATMPNPGSIGFFSQSGAMCLAILDWSLDNAIGFSKFISLGNKTDLTEAEILELLADDPDTKVIMGYLEAVEDGKQFMEVARRVTRKKPVVLLKSGVTAAGARAASSHTGALAGADAAYDAAFKQCGILRANSIKELFNLAQSLAQQPLPNGPALGIVTNSGGPGIICADAAEQNGLHLASLRPESHDELREVLPAIASVYNPVDITGGARSDLYAKSLKIVADDPNVDSIVVIMSPTSTVNPNEVAQDICAVKMDKPVFSALMGRHSVEESRLYCMGQGMPAYDFPEDAVQAIKGMLDYKRWRDSKPPEPEFVDGDKEAVTGIISKLREQGRLQMSENEARECFKAYGIPVAGSLAAATSKEAAEAAAKLGYPVVMKIDSPAISHKSDVGGVVVGLKNHKQVVEAFHDMTARVRRIMPNAWMRGVLVQEMVPSGRECILGLNKDPQFGHLLMFGLGGIYVEVLKDVSFRVAPISRKEATEMIKSIKSFALLQGVRGDMPADIPGLAQALLGLSTLAHDFPEIAEADINPLLVRERGQGVVAVDARISLTQQKGDE